MLEKFNQNNKAETIRRWLNTVDQGSADILSTERDIYAALSRSQKARSTWLPTPIAPFAEPVDLNSLVGDLFNYSQEEIRFSVGRVDNLYTWLSDLNNVLKSEIESVEKAVMQATDDIQDISVVVGDENRSFYWVSDSFNNSSFVDLTYSTSLIDTDYGMATLGPKQLQAISEFDAFIDREQTIGIPGANLYVVNPGKFGLKDKERSPVLETTNTRNFGTIFDLDPSTWFEIERNFIPRKQKIIMEGRSFVSSESGEEKDILEITKKYDWTAIVEWPDGYQDGGADGKGRSLVEFRNLDTENVVSYESNSANENNPSAKLVFEVALKTPQSISTIKLLPMIREDGAKITVDYIQVSIGDSWIDVVKEIELGTNRSTTRLQREILRRTGVQLTGSVFSVPTDRDIYRIRIALSSPPAPVKNGFAHIFQDVYTSYRTERNYGLFSSVNKWKDWGRKPYNEKVPTVKSSKERPAVVGTIMGAAQTVYTLGKTWTSLGSVTAGIGGTLGAAGAWLGSAVPVVGAILAIDQLVGGLFSIDKSSKVLETRVGYDVFKGYRSAIAIRDLTLVKMTYSEESILQSVKRDFPGPVNKVGLFVDEYIPEHWGPGDWISYFVSIDGASWIPIPKLTDTTLEKSLVLAQPTRTIFFKAILKGNQEDIYHSPAVRHYALQGVPS